MHELIVMKVLPALITSSLLVAASFWQHPIVIGIAVTVPPTILGLLGYRHSRKIDKDASENQSIGTLVDTQNSVIENLQEDNKALRETDRARLQELAACRERIDYLEKGGMKD